MWVFMKGTRGGERERERERRKRKNFFAFRLFLLTPHFLHTKCYVMLLKILDPNVVTSFIDNPSPVDRKAFTSCKSMYSLEERIRFAQRMKIISP